MRLVYLSLAWVLGIFLGSRYGLGWDTASILLSIFALFAILSRQRKALLWSGLCLLLLFGGILRFQSVSDSDALASYRGFFELRGVVAADPDIRDYATTLRLEVSEVSVDGEWRNVSGKAMVSAPRFPDLGNSRDFPYYRYGDRLEMGGVLESPGKTEEFDFKEYLARQGIYSIVSRPRGIKLIDTDQKPKPMELIYRLRNSMSQSMDRALPEPQSSLAKAILIGERGSMSTQVKEDFSRTGTSHLLAISGSNVSIVAGMALGAGVWAFGRKRPTYFFLALGVVWFYTLLAGMSPPVVRAAIMGSLWLWADSMGRPNSAFVALVLTAAVMLAVDPLLLGDVGFQLSFAAMAGLVLLTPIFHNWGKKTFGNHEGEVGSTTNFMIVSCAVTLGAVLATLPLIAYYFGLISIMSMPATFFALPSMPGIMVTAGLVGLVGIFAPSAAWVLGWVAWLFVTYMLKVVQIFADIPFASVDIKVSAPAVGVYYGILVAALWLPKNAKRVTDGFGKVKERLRKAPQLAVKAPAKWIVLPLVVAAVLIWVAALTASDGRLHISVLDIGQGDSILISKGN
ncbi:MAG: ComEC/Rec2 family competence protein, partial [Dehalococcoidia bacterium]